MKFYIADLLKSIKEIISIKIWKKITAIVGEDLKTFVPHDHFV